ncbi:MAG: TetR/AcrR family transcriptional regulator [Sakamotonia sp.]|jgi:AcrR family transcriptional regulator
MDSALTEFSKKGYGASSINTICSAENISKGIIYHYFSTKDDLFLACVEECFTLLTEYLKTGLCSEEEGAAERLEEYFSVRMDFFRENPVYQRIFCEAVITPPEHLRSGIQKRKQGFDLLNDQILEQILESVALRPQVTKDEVVDMFRRFQDFINANRQIVEFSRKEFEIHEENCRKAVDILLYGVVNKGERKSG